jgi:RNA polymerase sigma-70 factor, ECF subfamily
VTLSQARTGIRPGNQTNRRDNTLATASRAELRHGPAARPHLPTTRCAGRRLCISLIRAARLEASVLTVDDSRCEQQHAENGMSERDVSRRARVDAQHPASGEPGLPRRLATRSVTPAGVRAHASAAALRAQVTGGAGPGGGGGRILDPRSLTKHVDRLYRAAWALCGSREDAEDLVQETFARVLSRPRLLHVDEDIHYLTRTLRNTFLNGRRAASRRPVTAATFNDVVAEDPRPISRPESALEMRDLYATIAELPADFRLALIAVDVLGLSYGEASRALKVPEATITTRLFRARRRLAARLLPPAAGRSAAGRSATARAS